jgi:rod shape-determining protein MreD
MMAAITSKTISQTIRSYLPFMLAMILVLVLRLPVRTGTTVMFFPYVGLAFVFYWVLHGRKYAPAWIVFALGLFEDMVTIGPAGINSIILISVSVGLANQRRFFINRPFTVAWAGFAIVAFGATFLRWLLESFYVGEFLSVLPMLAQLLVTIATYPIFGLIFGKLRKIVV